jgi:hypothetical protein
MSSVSAVNAVTRTRSLTKVDLETGSGRLSVTTSRMRPYAQDPAAEIGNDQIFENGSARVATQCVLTSRSWISESRFGWNRNTLDRYQQAKGILLGFSGTGALVGRFPEYAPDRVLAAIASDPGHGDTFGVDTINLSTKAAAVPQLILVGSDDAVSGTERPCAYFRKYFDQGAPWTFVVQNGTPHCCIINAQALVLAWLNAVVIQRATRSTGSYGFITTQESKATECPPPNPPANPIWCRGATDSWGGKNWLATAAKVERRPIPPQGMLPAGWLPSRQFARLWRSFVTMSQHPLTSRP